MHLYNIIIIKYGIQRHGIYPFVGCQSRKFSTTSAIAGLFCLIHFCLAARVLFISFFIKEEFLLSFFPFAYSACMRSCLMASSYSSVSSSATASSVCELSGVQLLPIFRFLGAGVLVVSSLGQSLPKILKGCPQLQSPRALYTIKQL